MKVIRQPVLYGVGIGPGDPELMTVKAVKVLKGVDVIAVPKSKKEAASLALDITREVIDTRGKKIIELMFPMNRNQLELVRAWEESKRQIIRELNRGRDVAFTTIGDPLIHSTFIYLLEAMKKEGVSNLNYSISIVPGVSSINAAAASAQIPLVNGGERMAIIPATYGTERIKETLKEFDTVILIKIHKLLDLIVDILDELNMKDNAAYVSRVSQRGETITMDMASLGKKQPDYFSMLIVKKKKTITGRISSVA